MELLSGIYIENISRQSGIVSEFFFPKTFDKSKDFIFGFSGDNTTIFSIKTGLIIDNNNKNIFSLNYDQDIRLKIQISSGILISSINDIIISQSHFSGYIDNLFFSGENNNFLGLKVSGEIPELSFNLLNNFSGDNNIITGEILNNTPSRFFKIKNAYVDSSSKSVSVSGYTTGDISGSGFIYLQADTGVQYPTGNINLILETNFKNINYNINSNPTNPFILDQYLQLFPGENIILSVDQNKTFDIISYFNSGSSREISIKLEYVSGCTFAPVDMIYSFNGSGNIYNNNIVGSGNLTGTITGYYTGSGINVESGYSEPYVFTGNYTGTHSTIASGLHNGNSVTGEIFSGYNINLISGNSGIINFGSGTGLITGNIAVLSGVNPNGSFTMYGPGSTGYYLTGYTGYFANMYSGNRSYIQDSGLYFTLKISGLIPAEVNNCIFDIGLWEYCTTGSGGHYITGFNGDGFNFHEIICSGSEYSGVSGPNYVFTGKIADSGSSFNINNFIGEQTSGFFKTYIGVFNGYTVPSLPWKIMDFSINNFPVEQIQSINSTGTGYYDPLYITGSVSKFKSDIILYTGITEYPGQAVFSNVWNLKTGFSNFIYTDFKYNNLYTTSTYENAGSNLISILNNRNLYFLEIDFTGLSLSGNSVSKLIIDDGILSGVYYITGQGEMI